MEDEDETATCKRCGKMGHGKGRKCKAPFAKSWLGQTAMKVTLRGVDMTLEMTCALTQDQHDRIYAVCLEAWKGPVSSTDVPDVVPV